MREGRRPRARLGESEGLLTFFSMAAVVLSQTRSECGPSNSGLSWLVGGKRRLLNLKMPSKNYGHVFVCVAKQVRVSSASGAL
jgi:hypothetical protein